MRVSSSTIFDTNVAALSQQQSTLLHTNQQLSAGKRILTPADDPIAAANALVIAQADGTNTQYTTNRNSSKASNSMAESILQNVTTLIQDVKTSAVQAGNPALSATDKQAISTDLQSKLDQLISLANSTDGTGNYLFSGFQGRTLPFANTAAGVQYMADDGQRMVQVSSTRQLPTSSSGADIFMRIKNGNGTFVTQATATNTGSAIIDQGIVTNPASLTGSSYQLNFTSATSYTVTETTAAGVVLPSVPVAPALPYSFSSGQALTTIPGMQFTITGTPIAGDSFSVKPSTNVSIFSNISNLINALNAPATPGISSNAKLTSAVNTAINGFDRSIENVLTVRSSLGSHLNELDSLQTTGDDLGLQYKQSLSTLQDLNYTQAISDLNQQTLGLQAAQKSFKQIADLSLFNYM